MYDYLQGKKAKNKNKWLLHTKGHLAISLRTHESWHTITCSLSHWLNAISQMTSSMHCNIWILLLSKQITSTKRSKIQTRVNNTQRKTWWKSHLLTTDIITDCTLWLNKTVYALLQYCTSTAVSVFRCIKCINNLSCWHENNSIMLMLENLHLESQSMSNTIKYALCAHKIRHVDLDKST